MKHALASVAIALLSGCLIKASPATGLGPNGQPMTVKSERGKGVTTTNDVVGSDTIHHKDGSLSAVEIRADVDHEFAWRDYSFYQGSARIDEEDFYRLAGDRASEQEVRKARAGGRKLQWIGLAIMTGAVVLGGGLTALGIANDSTGLAIGGTIGGLVLIAPGAALYGGGRGRMDDKIVPEDTAIAAADEVIRCVDGECSNPMPAGRKFRDGMATAPTTPPASAAAPPAVAPPPAPPTSIIGAWRGNVTLTVAQKGQTPSTQSDEVTFEIERASGSTVVFWPNAEQKDPKCRFVATLAGTRATFKPQKACTVKQDDGTTTLSVRSGSLELRGSRLHLELAIEAAMRSKRGAAMSGSMSYSGSGEPVR